MLSKVVVFILLGIFYVSDGRESYNTQTYYIAPHDFRLVNKITAFRYFALNVGRHNVTIQILWGDTFYWRGIREIITLQHGESYHFSYETKRQYQAVKVINDEDENAFVHVYATRYGYPEFDYFEGKYFDIDSTELTKTIVATGATYVPVAGEVLSSIVEFFWPDGGSVWDEIEDQVSDLIDERARETIEGLLGGDLEQIRDKIKMCSYEIEHPNITKTIKTHYVGLAENLIGFERKFSLTMRNSVSINFYLLTFYSTVINLKLKFYQYGIVHKDLIGLNDEHIERLKYYINELLYDSRKGAIEYVHKVCDDKLNETYRDSYAEYLYDELASVREYCALNGFEHIPVWKSLAKDPLDKKRPEIPVVVYSTQFGRNTAKQSSQMVYPDYPSITPKLFNGTLNHPTEIRVFLTTSNKIGGFKITSADGNAVHVGPTSFGESVKIDFEGKKLLKLVARGTGQIDGLEFTFEGDRSVKVGTLYGNSRTFDLTGHHIIGLYATDSMEYVDRTQIANIAVSYQAIVKQKQLE